jgi:hypothetical protein
MKGKTMIRIINGRRYNTQTAIDVLALDCNAGYYVIESNTDLRYEDTELYITKNGQWFLAGYGNAMSRWAQSCGGNSYGPGQGIEPISAEEAQSILENHGQTELIEKYFGDTIQDA